MFNLLKGNMYFTVLCMITIAFLSLLPQESLPKPHFSFEDLVVHFVMYSGLALCAVFSFYKKSISTIKLFFFIVLYGILMEILQKYLPINRFFSLSDILANTLGACSIFQWRTILKKK